MLEAEFSVGEPPHSVGVRLALLSGLEVYTVDGVEVLRVRSFAPNGRRSISIPGEHPHSVEIRVKTLPTWRTEAYANGQLVVCELFPNIRKVDRVLNWILIIGLAVLALVGAAALIMYSWLNR